MFFFFTRVRRSGANIRVFKMLRPSRTGKFDRFYSGKDENRVLFIGNVKKKKSIFEIGTNEARCPADDVRVEIFRGEREKNV